MKTRTVELERFEEVVTIVRCEFRRLAIEVNREHPHVEALATIPEQAGLDFPVSFNLQNCDELHLNVPTSFWAEWFPCGRQDVFDQFVEALTGVLSGRFRVLESCLFDTPVSARLKRPTGPNAWKTVSSSNNMWALVVPWPRTHRIVQNRPSV